MTATTTEEREAKVAALLATATAQIASLLDADAFRAWVAFSARFRTYSLFNQMLIAAQRPEATLVAGFHAWRQRNRWVRKGETGIAIFCPMLHKDKEDPDKHYVKGFRVGYVFDVSQTEGADAIPERPTPLRLEEDVPTLRAYEERLECWLAGQGVAYEVKPLFGPLGSYWPSQKTIAVDAGLSTSQRFKTLLHECGHHLHWSRHQDGPSYQSGEVVVETAAFIASAYVGLDTSQYSVPYVAGWAADKEVLRANLAEAQAVALDLSLIVSPT